MPIALVARRSPSGIIRTETMRLAENNESDKRRVASLAVAVYQKVTRVIKSVYSPGFERYLLL